MMLIVKKYISRIPTIPIYPIYILSDPIRSHRYPLLRLNNGQVRRIHQAREHRAGGTGRLMSCPKARIKRPKLSWFQGDFPPFWAAESAGSGSASGIIPIYPNISQYIDDPIGELLETLGGEPWIRSSGSIKYLNFTRQLIGLWIFELIYV